MGIIENEINNISRIQERLRRGTITAKEFKAEITASMAKKEWVEKKLTCHMIAVKYGKTHFDAIAKTNLIGDGSAVDLDVDIENDQVTCPDKNDALITRAECLEYSGDAANMDNCRSCGNFRITRKMLLPPR